MRPIHHRMPVMLMPEQFEPWLDPRVTQPEDLAPLLRTPPADAMIALAVSGHVSNVRHQGPECIAPADSKAAAEGRQFSLGLE